VADAGADAAAAETEAALCAGVCSVLRMGSCSMAPAKSAANARIPVLAVWQISRRPFS
jgi:hypothetical protein